MEGDRRRESSGDGKLRLSIPPRSPLHSGLRYYPSFPFPSSPFPSSPSISSTPSKRRSSSSSSGGAATSLSSIFFLLFSLRSLYSLLPFIRSSPANFSLFPFSFLVSFFSFVLTAICFFLIPSSSSDPARLRPLPSGRKFFPLVAAKSLLLALGFLLRFQALRTCGTAVTILVEFSGAIAAWSVSRSSGDDRRRIRKIRGFAALAAALVLLSHGWDRIGCFPLSSSSFTDAECLRISPLLLPFLSGMLGFYECSSCNWAPLRDLGQRRLRLLSLGLSTAILFFPALTSFLMNDVVGMENLGWSLANTVIFGVVLAGNLAGMGSIPFAKDFRREFLSTFLCTVALELFYNPRLSLAGFLIASLLLWISVDQLASPLRTPPELESPQSGYSFASMAYKPLRHIWSERKSRKIFLFLLINSAYMVVEFAAGFLSNSLGLISDACHMLFDCAALAIGLYASYISRLPASSQFNYGRGRFEVLSGYVNAVFLVLVGALIVLESFERILDPQEISTSSVLSVSVGGLLVNLVGLIFFHEEHHHAHGGGACSHSHPEPNHHHLAPHHHSHSPDHHHNGHDHEHHDHFHHHGTCGHSHPSELNHPELNHPHHSTHHHSHSPDHHHGSHDHQHCDHSHHHETSNHSHSPDLNHSDPNHHCHSPHHPSHSPDHHLGGHDGHSHHHSSKKHHLVDHNMRGVFLHVLADTMGSVGVVISTLLVKYKGWIIADPACSILISIMIISSVIPLLKNSAEILLQRFPRIHEPEIKESMKDVTGMNGVLGVDQMHFWSFTTTDIVGTIHLRVSADCDKDLTRKQVSGKLGEAGVNDLTIQLEYV